MAQVSGTTDSYDLIGIAEDVEDIIYDISPTETPLVTMAKRGKADSTNHQWQTDALDAAATNAQIEGDDATYATAAPTTMLSNRTQILRKTILVSRTADRVRKYGRDRETARLIVKRGKEIKRDLEYAAVRNQRSSVGGSGTARYMAGLESMITNRVMPANSGAGTTPGYSSGDWVAPTDGTVGTTADTSTLTETLLKDAIQAAWDDGGDPGVIMCNYAQKKQMSTFQGSAKFAGNYVEGNRTSQGIVVGGVDLYISDVGEHRVKLNRYMRNRTIFLLDPDTIEIAWLDRIKPVPLAKTGDAEKSMLIGEATLVVTSPEGNAKIADLFPNT